MDAKKQKDILKSSFILFIILIIIAISFSIYFMAFSANKADFRSRSSDSFSRNYHIIITGRYENSLFLKKVFDGANRYSDYYNSVVELYVPGSQAEDVPLQSLLDYVSYVNADGVIVFNESTDELLNVPYKNDSEVIPLVTTGQYNANLPQISYIGTSYWELGKKISDEAISYIHGNGNISIINPDSSTNNYSNLLNSLQDGLKHQKSINYTIINEKDLFISELSTTNLIICLTEDDTIKVAQKLQEYSQVDKNRIGVLGFGTNETCQMYLDKGIVSELIAVDPEKIGETAIKELFEYKTKGYANSYIAADVTIYRGANENSHLR